MRLCNYLIQLDVPDHTPEHQFNRILEALEEVNLALRVQRFVNKELLEANHVLLVNDVVARVVD
jgi:hypothetical protein